MRGSCHSEPVDLDPTLQRKDKLGRAKLGAF